MSTRPPNGKSGVPIRKRWVVLITIIVTTLAQYLLPPPVKDLVKRVGDELGAPVTNRGDVPVDDTM